MYEPAEDSFLLKETLDKELSGIKIQNALDMATGSGIIAEKLAEFSENVIAVEIEEQTIKQIQNKLNKKIVLIKSDLFQNVPKQKFDLITFNPPYLPEEEFLKEDKETIGGKTGIEITLKFLLQAKQYLSETGKILFIASSLAPLEDLEKEMEMLGYKYKQINKKHIFFEDIIVYEAHL